MGMLRQDDDTIAMVFNRVNCYVKSIMAIIRDIIF